MNRLGLLLAKSERIYDRVAETLNRSGIFYEGGPNNGSYMTATNIPWLTVIFRKDPDIPLTLLSPPFPVAGFVGYDYTREIGLKSGRYGDFVRLVDTKIAACRMVVAGPEGSYNSLSELRNVEGLRVGSKYPYTAEAALRRRGIRGKFVERSGSIEGMPALGECDIIVDIEYTGNTLRENRLRRIATLFEITTGLYTTAEIYGERQSELNQIGRRVQAAVNARGKLWLEANVSNENLQRVLGNMPAMKSPTIAELGDRSGVGIKSVVDRDTAFELIAQLESLGAQDVVTYPLETVGISGTYRPTRFSEADLEP